jgi:amidase
VIKRFTIITLLPIFLACNGQESSSSLDVTELTIAEIHRQLQQGELTCKQLVLTYIEKIEQINDKTNAISYINPRALEIAKKLDDEFLETGVLRPLHGIPIIVKDNIDTKGLPTTAGSISLLGYVPNDDAYVIKRLIEAGAIILAKSNMAEWAFSPMHTQSSTIGITRNPYNLDYVPAGSSGGTAAAVAANMGTVGLGTDTGNSIRGPSSHCNLVGFRTTMGLISRTGVVPLYLRNDVVGPMCRTVEDATKMLNVMAGYDPDDPITEYSKKKIKNDYTKFLVPDGLRGSKIGVLRQLSDYDPDPEVLQLFEKALFDLDSLGAEIFDPLVIRGFDTLRLNHWCASFRSDIEKFLANNVRSDTLVTLEDVIRIGTNSVYTAGRLEQFANNHGRWSGPRIECGDAFTDPLRIRYREAIEKVMDSLDLDAIVYPTWNNKPARIDFFSEEYRGDNSQIIAPHTGQPAFTVPMGLTSGNLPTGLQFLGKMFSEPTLIRLAYAYEQGTLHRSSP